MRLRRFSWLLVALATAGCGLPGSRAADETIDPKKLVGVWLYKDDNIGGGLEAYSVCRADGTQVNIAYLSKLDRWLFEEFTWKLDGRTIVTTETRTNIPDLHPGKVSTTDIVSLNDGKLVCRERGAEHTETKIGAMPSLFASKLAELQRDGESARGVTPGPESK